MPRARNRNGLAPHPHVAKLPAKRPAPAVAARLAALEQEIGGRDALIAALLHAPASRDLAYLLGVLGGPDGEGESLAQLCVNAGITPGEVVQAYTAGEIARGQAVATHHIGQRLGEVAADTMRIALPHEITCLECEGLGQVASEDGPPATCQTCHGRGHHPAEGDLDHKKLALEMGKLLQKGGGVNLNVNQQVNTLQVGTAGGALELLQSATDKILYGEGGAGPAEDVVEAEVVEAEEGDPDAATLDTDWQGHPL